VTSGDASRRSRRLWIGGAREAPLDSVAAIFDLDGLLVDSEPLWVRAEREVFAGVGLGLTDQDCARTTGLRIDEVTAWWFARRPWTGAGPAELAARIVTRVAELMATEGRALPGAQQAVAMLAAAGVPLALASSSSHRLIDAALDRLDLGAAFPVRCSAQDEARGKPDPAVYLRAAAALSLPPAACVALEDSPSGLAAALAAGMRCIAVPDPARRAEPCWGDALCVLDSLEALDLATWRRLSALAAAVGA